jgi:hypothetical protein
MFNLKNAFYRKMHLCLSIFHLEKLSKPSCVLKESRTNCLLGFGEHADDIWFGKWKWKFSAK